MLGEEGSTRLLKQLGDDAFADLDRLLAEG